MKSPDDLRQVLVKQWQLADKRLERLLSADAWPVSLTIGKPTVSEFSLHTARIQAHIRTWREVKVGTVQWEAVMYRNAAEPFSVPVAWVLSKPSQWIDACHDTTVRQEFQMLEAIVTDIQPEYRRLLVKARHLWRHKTVEEVVQSIVLAESLSPGIAKGLPLRLLGDFGQDTKFIERNRALLTQLLDVRYNGAASEQGLDNFLDARREDHWLLVVPLEPGLLPFERMKVPSQTLSVTPLPCDILIVVENEQCAYLLPALRGGIAVLGSGLDLEWLSEKTHSYKTVIYWGDIDTWGLKMLARARTLYPEIQTLLMNRCVFERYRQKNAVIEPTIAQRNPPVALTEDEKVLYRFLVEQERGRLEQEFITTEDVTEALKSLEQITVLHSDA